MPTNIGIDIRDDLSRPNRTHLFERSKLKPGRKSKKGETTIMSRWPSHRPWIPERGKEPALQFASKNPSENINFPLIEEVNKVLPGKTAGMIMAPTVILTDQGGGTTSRDDLDVVLEDDAISQQDVRVLGSFAGISAAPTEVNLGMLYRQFVACKTLDDLHNWFKLTQPNGDWDSFQRHLNIEAERKKLEAAAVANFLKGLPITVP